jgi:hypothetical protein
MEAATRRARRQRREEAWRRGASAHTQACTCGAPIRWALTAADPPGWMPLAAAADPDGSVVVIRDGAAPIAHVNPPAELAGDRLRWRPHWPDCPHASQHRRRSR